MADKLYHSDAAEYLGISASTWRDYTSARAGKPPRGPAPDGTDVDDGHARPYWHRATLDAWNAGRPGRGKGGGRKPRVE